MIEGNLNSFDLMAILIEKEAFDIELNGTDMFNINSDWIWSEIFENKIVEANTFGDSMIYIKYIKDNAEQELIIIFDFDIEDYFGVA